MTITRTLVSTVSASLGLLLGLSPAIAAGPGATAVETFNATWVASTTLPGVANRAGGVKFAATERLTGIEFGAGATEFAGAKVDFAGNEDQFIASRTSTSWVTDVGAQALKANAAAACKANVAVEGAVNAVATGGGTGLTALAGFDAKNLNLAVGSAVKENFQFAAWNSNVVPELNGAAVTIETVSTLDSIDAVSGVAEGSSSGVIYASEGVVKAYLKPARVGNSLGLGALFVGLAGSFLTLRSRRNRDSQPLV